jgi:hypothetical protein
LFLHVYRRLHSYRSMLPAYPNGNENTSSEHTILYTFRAMRS